jgi:uncharacterized membrane protein
LRRGGGGLVAEGVGMDWEDAFPVVAIALVAAFVMAAKAMRDARASRLQLADLTEKFWMLDHRLVRLAEQFAAAAQPGEAAAPEAAPAEAPQPAPVAAAPVAAEPAAVPEPPATPVPEAAAPPAPPLPAPPLPAAARTHWEQLLVENWLVWLGGATLALGGAFLVKLSIDYGLLTPDVRVILAIALGVGLSFAAEWVRRRDVPPEGADAGDAGGASYVPQALAAAGAATVFAAIYAAHQLYGLLPSGVAFVLLAATAIAAVGQSLRHGPLVAALGLIGAYAVPLLVQSEAPHALPLFAYLAVVTAASLALLRHRAWWWLVWFSLAGAMVWVPLWLGGAADPETPVVAGYLLAQFALFVAFRHGVARVAFLAGLADTMLVRVALRAALWAIAFGLLLVAHADHFGVTSVATATLAIVGLLLLGYRDAPLDDSIAVAGALALVLLASWNLPLPTPEMNLWVFRVQPDHVANFTTAAILFAALLGGGGFAALPRAARPGRWAALSAAAPLVILIIAYWRLQKFELPVAWTMAALALAAVQLGAAVVVAQRRAAAAAPAGAPASEIEIALAAYAVGVLGSTISAAAFGLSEAWLTVAFALHLPAIGWVERRLRVNALRWVALGIAATVLIRLLLNPYVLDYPLGPTPIVNWLLYGYGVPAAAFIVATRQFGATKDDALVWVLEAGSIVFLLLLLTLELIHALYGRLTMGWIDDFGIGAALVALWLAFAMVVIGLGESRQRPVLRWGGRLVLTTATLFSVLWHLVMLVFGFRPGTLPVVNALLLAGAVPALIYATLAWLVPHRPVLRAVARVLAAFYAFAWVTLEIRHLFHERVQLGSGSTEFEWYAYSVAWLAFAGATLAFGLVRGNEWVRRAGLIGIALVIAKVFLSDMAELSGVLRALSFIGLGGALVGLGYAYRRMRPLQHSPS